MTRPTHESRAIDAVTDVYGVRWLVREYRETAHGFSVAIGWPDEKGPHGMAAILTPALAEYLTATERVRDIDLPIALTTVKRLRSEMGLRFDWDTWWRAREADLQGMTLEAFAAKHNCSTGAASQRRTALQERLCGEDAG